MDLNTLLNPKQKEAATYLDGHLRIIAGAGSGKTRVITYRIAYLIQEMGVHPRHILAITFTNKAANEMKERVEALLGNYASQTTICTIHSLCVRVLRQHSQLLGYPHNFIILDEEDQKALLKKLMKDDKIDLAKLTVKNMIHYISSYKTNFVSPEKAMSSAGSLVGEQVKAKIYGLYEEYNKKHNMMDFDDLLLNALKIFQDNPDVVEKWSHRYQYVHVDEFQDVGSIEYQLVRFFGSSSIVCVVGDPDQTIYSFRGSDVNYIMNFDKDYENTKTIMLEQNYRSTKTILGISNNLIRKNSHRLEKNLYTDLEEGRKVVHYSAISEEAEAKFICDKIEALIYQEDQLNYADFAILYRANYLSRPIEQELIRRGIDYKIFGGLKFFNRREVKDALSYLRLLANEDDLSFERVVNVPSRGVGPKTLERIQLVATRYGISDYQALCFYSDEIRLTGKARKELKTLVTAIEKARMSVEALEEVFETLLDDVGYMDMLKKDHEDNRIENIMELKNAIASYMKDHPETADFESYLQDIALYTTQDEATPDRPFVSMMSIHMAKGLEFNYVFVAGLSEDVFPNMRAVSEQGDEGLEEERRLAYVAFTRAKKGLFLSDNQSYSYISQSPKIASRFLEEIGRDRVEHVGTPSRFKTRDYVNMQPSFQDLVGDNEIDDWKIGDLCIHDTFGKGVVVKVQATTIDVAFSMPYGIKTLLSTHKAIKRLSH